MVSPFAESIRMDDHDDISREKLSELVEYTRRPTRTRDPRQRPGVHESIRNSRSTLLINLLIEIASGLVLFMGIAYTMKFLYARKAYIEPGEFRLYTTILVFFSVGWFTYVGFKIRAKYRALRNAGKAPESPPLPPRRRD